MTEERVPPADTQEEEGAAPARQMPIGIVVARILVVSGLAVAAALAIFLLVGGLWLPGAVALAAAALFLFLMFAIERGAA